MLSNLPFLKSIYHGVTPSFIKESSIVIKLKRLLSHNDIYDAGYYAIDVEGPAVCSAKTIAASIVSTFKPRNVIDVGCGTGALLDALRDRGCETFGLEYSDAGLAYCRERRLDVMKFDIEHDIYSAGRRFDVAISMEVAEHLPKKIADRYVDLLTQLSLIVIFTAAPPGQGGVDHVNEQPPAYWIDKFNRRGFHLADILSTQWKEDWQAAGDVASWYWRNLMIFERMPPQ